MEGRLLLLSDAVSTLEWNATRPIRAGIDSRAFCDLTEINPHYLPNLQHSRIREPNAADFVLKLPRRAGPTRSNALEYAAADAQNRGATMEWVQLRSAGC